MTARRRRLRLLVLGATLAILLGTGVGYAAVRHTPTALVAEGPTAVSGTSASAVFTIEDRRIRQVRYRDRGVLTYRFRLVNDEAFPVTVVGIDPAQRDPRLFGYLALEDAEGAGRIEVPGRGAREVRLRMRMSGCETLSARAGSFADSVLLRTERLGISAGSVRLSLPEEIHTGSPRESFCPDSTAQSRSPG